MEEQREADKLVLVYESLFRDIVYQLPQLNVLKVQKDLNYVRRSARERGIQFFVLDLPLLGKHLDRALDEGRFPPSTLVHTYALRHGSKTIPVFLGSLYELIFADNGSLRDDYSVDAIRALRQVLYLAKKLHQPFSVEDLSASVGKLFEEDTILPLPERYWNEDAPPTCLPRVSFTGFKASRWYSSKLLGQCGSEEPVSTVLDNLDIVSRLICGALGVFKPSEHRLKHGPGAISQSKGPSNKYRWYGWSERLESVYPLADYGFHSYASWAGMTDPLTSEEKYTPFSRLVAVPKTYAKPRLIAAEPSEHQWCQQNLWAFMKCRAETTWLSNFVRFNDQGLNQALCLKGSKDGTLCTVDLSSASDRVSCHAVGNFFRYSLGLLDALRATRTQVLHQTLEKSLPKELNLRKFSTMGSAVTFPVQSLLFLGIALSAVLTNEKKAVTMDNIMALSEKVAVFGDDIIVPSTSRKLLQRALEILDFRVNESKTYSEGNFRESCGVDCFKGEYVTPVFLRSLSSGSPEAVASVVDCANNFYYSFYLHTAAHLESTGPADISAVRADSGCFGYHSRCPITFKRKRWNAALQREEARMMVVRSSQGVVRSEDDSALHQYFTELPDPFSEWVAGVRQRPKVKLTFAWVDVADCS